MKWIKFILLPLTFMVFAACSSKDKVEIKEKVVFDNKEIKHIEAISRFSFDVYNGVIAEGDYKSMVMSPLSYYLTLNMLHNSKELDLSVLKDLSMEDLNELSKKIIDRVSYPEEDIENSLYNCCIFNTGVDQIDNTSTLSDWFYASIYKMNFSNTGEVEKILLDWINSKSKEVKLEKTPVKIQELQQKVLCNVTNFHGKWSVPFDKKETKKANFTSWDGTVKDIDMMQSNSAYFPCYEGDGVKSVEIAYGKKGEYLMTVIMSDSEKLSYDDFKNIRLKLNEKQRNLKVHFPKFSIEVKDLMLKSYCAGIPECLQIAKIIVDEEGSKATAVSTIIDTSVQPEPVDDFLSIKVSTL